MTAAHNFIEESNGGFSPNLKHPINYINDKLFTNFSEVNETKSYVAIAGCILDYICSCPVLSPLEKLFYICTDALSIIKFNKGEGRVAVKSATKWAKQIGCSKSKIFSLQKSLEEKGYFALIKNKNKEGQNNNNIIVPTLPLHVFQELNKSLNKKDVLPISVTINNNNFVINSNSFASIKDLSHRRSILDNSKLFIKLNYSLLKSISSNNELSPLQKIIWLDFYTKCYKSHIKSNKMDEFCFTASYEELSRRYSSSKSTISKSIKMLEDSEFITKEHFFVRKEDLVNSRKDNSLWKFTLTTPFSLGYELINSQNRSQDISVVANFDVTTGSSSSEIHSVSDCDLNSFVPKKTLNKVLLPVQSNNEISSCDPGISKFGQHINKDFKTNISNLDSEIEKSFDANKNLSEFYKNNFIKKEKELVSSDSLKNIVTVEQGSNVLIDEFTSEITPCKKENIQVQAKKEVSLGYKEADQKAYKTKHLKDFYPLTKEETSDINWKAGREFSTNFTNELLLKLADKYPNRTFISRNHMLSYISKALRYEKHQAPLVNHETFRFVKNDKEAIEQRAKEKYLIEIEDTRSIDKYSQLRRKIAASLETNIAYLLLTSCEFKMLEDSVELVKTEGSTKLEENKENIFKIKLSPKINLTEFQKEKLENEVKAVYGDIEIIYEYEKEKRVGWFNNNSKFRSSSKTNEIETNNPVLREIYKLLKMYNGEEKGKNIYISWFSKIDAEITQETKQVILKAPNNFTRDWVKNTFRNIFEEACKNLNLYLDKFNPILV